jgi:hypothetical protein
MTPLRRNKSLLSIVIYYNDLLQEQKTASTLVLECYIYNKHETVYT